MSTFCNDFSNHLGRSKSAKGTIKNIQSLERFKLQVVEIILTAFLLKQYIFIQVVGLRFLLIVIYDSKEF